MSHKLVWIQHHRQLVHQKISGARSMTCRVSCRSVAELLDEGMDLSHKDRFYLGLQLTDDGHPTQHYINRAGGDETNVDRIPLVCKLVKETAWLAAPIAAVGGCRCCDMHSRYRH